jgi:hypothetical protein
MSQQRWIRFKRSAFFTHRQNVQGKMCRNAAHFMYFFLIFHGIRQVLPVFHSSGLPSGQKTPPLAQFMQPSLPIGIICRFSPSM